ncbi:hypothetical protein HYH03_018765 [Edaphochlamys debaryana]|uniref:Uncharacterized protein n=1 Tax=Edaphochlamys debaryana TaxID=47281 RepID=A0A835XH81_9CHLO|nr:hypothetical protein HYH03_018765 [Edaphochlamys debaryana]|eukprot:KAG2482301.1 hypothetical protein HYH03_018765 [Edaphochlamys debaryana]
MGLMVDAQGAGNSDDRLKRRRLHAGLFPWESLFGPIKLTRSQLVDLHAACLRLEQLSLPYGAAALRGAIVCCEVPGGSVVVRRLLALDGDSVCVEGPRGVSCSLPMASVLEEEPTDAQWRQACVEAAGHLLRGSLRHWTCAEVRFTLQRLLELRLASEAIAAHAASQPSARQAQQQQRTSDPGLPPSRAAQDGAGPSQALPGRSFLRPRQLARPEGPGDDALRERLYEVLQVRARISDEQWREHASQLLPFTTADAIQALRRAAAAVASGAAGPSAAATAGGQGTSAAPAVQAATATPAGPNTTAAAAVPPEAGRVPVRAAVPGLRRAAAGRARQQTIHFGATQPLQRAAEHVRVASAPSAAAATARSLRAARGGAIVTRAAQNRTRPTTAPAGPSATTAGPMPGPGAQTVRTAPAVAPGGGSLQAPRVQLSATAHTHALGHVPAAAAAPAGADAHARGNVLAVAAAPAAAAPAAPAALALAAPAHGVAATTTTQPPRKRARPDVPTQPIAKHTAGAPTAQPGLSTPPKVAAGPQAGPVAPNPRRRREPADAGELESPAAPSHAKGTAGNEPSQPRLPLLTQPGQAPKPASLLPRQPLPARQPPAREPPGGAEVPPEAGPQPDQEQAQRPPSQGPASATAAAGRVAAAALVSGPALQPPAAVLPQTAAADAAFAPGPSSVRAASMGKDLSAMARAQARHGAQVQQLPAAPVPSPEAQTEEQHFRGGSQAAAQPLPTRPAAKAPALAPAAAASAQAPPLQHRFASPQPVPGPPSSQPRADPAASPAASPGPDAATQLQPLSAATPAPTQPQSQSQSASGAAQPVQGPQGLQPPSAAPPAELQQQPAAQAVQPAALPAQEPQPAAPQAQEPQKVRAMVSQASALVPPWAEGRGQKPPEAGGARTLPSSAPPDPIEAVHGRSRDGAHGARGLGLLLAEHGQVPEQRRRQEEEPPCAGAQAQGVSARPLLARLQPEQRPGVKELYELRSLPARGGAQDDLALAAPAYASGAAPALAAGLVASVEAPSGTKPMPRSADLPAAPLAARSSHGPPPQPQPRNAPPGATATAHSADGSGAATAAGCAGVAGPGSAHGAAPERSQPAPAAPGTSGLPGSPVTGAAPNHGAAPAAAVGPAAVTRELPADPAAAAPSGPLPAPPPSGGTQPAAAPALPAAASSVRTEAAVAAAASGPRHHWGTPKGHAQLLAPASGVTGAGPPPTPDVLLPSVAAASAQLTAAAAALAATATAVAAHSTAAAAAAAAGGSRHHWGTPPAHAQFLDPATGVAAAALATGPDARGAEAAVFAPPQQPASAKPLQLATQLAKQQATRPQTQPQAASKAETQEAAASPPGPAAAAPAAASAAQEAGFAAPDGSTRAGLAASWAAPMDIGPSRPGQRGCMASISSISCFQPPNKPRSHEELRWYDLRAGRREQAPESSQAPAPQPAPVPPGTTATASGAGAAAMDSAAAARPSAAAAVALAVAPGPAAATGPAAVAAAAPPAAAAAAAVVNAGAPEAGAAALRPSAVVAAGSGAAAPAQGATGAAPPQAAVTAHSCTSKPAAANGPQPMEGVDDYSEHRSAVLISISAMPTFQPPHMPWEHEELRWRHMKHHPDFVTATRTALAAAAAAAPSMVWPQATQLSGWGEPMIAAQAPTWQAPAAAGSAAAALRARLAQVRAAVAALDGSAAAAGAGPPAEATVPAPAPHPWPLEEATRMVPVSTAAPQPFALPGAGSKRSAAAAGLAAGGQDAAAEVAGCSGGVRLAPPALLARPLAGLAAPLPALWPLPAAPAAPGAGVLAAGGGLGAGGLFGSPTFGAAAPLGVQAPAAALLPPARVQPLSQRAGDGPTAGTTADGDGDGDGSASGEEGPDSDDEGCGESRPSQRSGQSGQRSRDTKRSSAAFGGKAAARAAKAEAAASKLPRAAVAWAERVLRFLRTQPKTQATYQQIRRKSLGIPRSVVDPAKPKRLLSYLRLFWPWFEVVGPSGSNAAGSCTLKARGGITWAKLEAQALRKLYDAIALANGVFADGLSLRVLESSPVCPPAWMRRGQALEPWMRHFRHWTLEDGKVKVVEGERP